MESGGPNGFDALYLRTLMNRLRLDPTSTSPSPSPSSLDDLLLDALTSLDHDYDEEDEDEEDSAGGVSRLSREESKLEREIVKVILSGDTASLKPNSGQAVAVGEHHVCVGFHEEVGSDYRVWEWHGHIMLFDEEDGFSPEYVYGNYFERLRRGVATVAKESEVEEGGDEDKVGNLGLRELIDNGGATADGVVKRVLHRNISAGSSKVL
ncbi:hypothetical protein MLD38_020269 [Melastoma candidum]|uniref:Uncharacterized protein n=1 Tax=Melastoma candidum TaxID=119954 RepID=A0ACB9QBZ3_9MYRT|nr:hypothetical protein MLD38_020269 [Melastoma candidum]